MSYYGVSVPPADGAPNSELGDFAKRSIRKVLIDWLADDATGAVSGTTEKIVGRLVKAVTDPGSPAPTANYDIDITDEEGADVLAARVAVGRLQNRHTTSTEQVYFFVENLNAAPLATCTHPAVCDKLTVSITNAGNAKVGQLILYVEWRAAMATGQVIRVKLDRGFGFIGQHDGPGQFFHVNDTIGLEWGEQRTDQHVEFDESVDQRSGKLRAVRVRPAN